MVTLQLKNLLNRYDELFGDYSEFYFENLDNSEMKKILIKAVRQKRPLRKIKGCL